MSVQRELLVAGAFLRTALRCVQTRREAAVAGWAICTGVSAAEAVEQIARLRLLAAPLSCGGGSFGSGTSRLSVEHNIASTTPPVAPAHPSVSHNGAHASKHAYHASPLLPTHDDSFEDACRQRADSALDHARGLHAALSIAGLFGPAHHRVITRLLRVDYAPVMTRLGSRLQRP